MAPEVDTYIAADIDTAAAQSTAAAVAVAPAVAAETVDCKNPFISILYFKVSFAFYLLSILIAFILAFFAVGISLA